MKRHWTYFLEEAGCIRDMGNDQYILNCKIQEMQHKLKLLKKEYKENEQEITVCAEINWTIEEIEQAKINWLSQFV
ncbi:MAG: hypothetical protein US15_C0012G0009 [Candidatus Moranbacteria bacterium GW2011_GWF1_36_4]|nr:MAG: hypothetical protein US15_C0012G0009 [Candidatus Moranbacteria bacterium GW2011_GWF1_36_4]